MKKQKMSIIKKPKICVDGNLHLLRTISKYPNIYDYTKYADVDNDNINRSETWEKVAREASVTATFARERYYNLRERYVKELRRQQSLEPTTPSGDMPSKFRYFNEMHFLRDFIRSRKYNRNNTVESTTGHLPELISKPSTKDEDGQPKYEFNITEEDFNDDDNDEMSEFIELDEYDSDNVVDDKGTIKGDCPNEVVELDDSDNSSSNIEIQSSGQTGDKHNGGESDEDAIFGSLVTAMLKNMSDLDYKKNVKRKIMNILLQ